MVVVCGDRLPGVRIVSVRFGNGMTGSRKSYRYWTPEELDKLEEVMGQTTFGNACERWNRWAKQHGFAARSIQSLRKKANEQGWSGFAWGDQVLIGTVAKLLGKHRSTIQQWVRHGWVTRQGGGRASAISRLELRRLARDKPQLFGGVPRPDLVQLLELEDLADWILEQAPRRWQSSRNVHRIRWVERGLVFAGYAAAGKAAHIDSKAIRQGVKQGRPVCGWRFERVA